MAKLIEGQDDDEIYWENRFQFVNRPGWVIDQISFRCSIFIFGDVTPTDSQIYEIFHMVIVKLFQSHPTLPDTFGPWCNRSSFIGFGFL